MKTNFRTDLAIDIVENSKIDGVLIDKYKENGILVNNVYLDKVGSIKIGKKIGNYLTIEFNDILDSTTRRNIIKIFTKELKKMLNKLGIKENDKCLVIGLGNKKSTPDSLGPSVVEKVVVTNHLFKMNMLEDGYRVVSAFNTGVMGTTGIETKDLIDNLVKISECDFLIVIDSLASGSIDRLNKTIQITDAGISPGSGIGNDRGEISSDTLNIPVIAIGVPTVVDAVTIVSDTINYMYKHYSYIKNNINNPSFKLKIGIGDYLKKEVYNENLNKDVFGIIGSLNDSELKTLINEVLTPINYNLMVTPKEVDYIIDKLSNIISQVINNVLHKNNCV